ncbi:ABC transporter permease [Opitutus terrae]|uniref:Permease n=1 Tax=Opitutus terrae (strain DSM 11246 / JCM 15787 / PB90-1) TaxID=452637 RepID=B1ZXV9_OPITP|nr:ABC transporter permease [Opitutus terrae]ACB75161.1 permease [Opitutus terrae PB90-1]
MLSDLRYAMRQMAKFPGYTTVVVLTLAFGIAVNTQIFMMVNAIFLQPMDVRDPDRLVAIVGRSNAINLPHQISFLDFQDLRDGSKSLTDHVAFLPMAAHVSAPGQSPERTWIEAVTPDAFSRMGVNVVLGRPLQPADGAMPPGTPVAVLTHRYWQTQFGGDPRVIGRSVLINAKPFTIVGVAKPGFESFSYSVSVSLWVPSGTYAQLRPDGDGFFKYRGSSAWRVLAHLAPGATLAEANAELGVFAQRFAQQFPDDHRGFRFQAILERHARPDPVMADLAPVIGCLFTGLVLLVLFIACANVANLMGSHALAREKELVVRAALGASRWRIVRLLLAESVLLAVLAGIVGYSLAWWGGDAMRSLTPAGDIPIRVNDSISWQVWAFTALVSFCAGVGAGLVPALRSSRIDLNEGLKQGAGRQTGPGRHRLRNLLVIGQVATSAVVLIASVLFLRGLAIARHADVGFLPDRLLMQSFDLNLQGYSKERGLQFQRDLLERVRALPGVEAASLAQHVPFTQSILMRDNWPDNPSGHVPDDHIAVAFSGVEPSFLKTFGIRLLRGRDLLPTDDERAPEVAVINEAMANAFWPGKDPIGQHFRLWRGGPAIEVVGVAATGKYLMIGEQPRPYYYRPFAQFYNMPATLVVRTQQAPHALAAPVRQVIQGLDPHLPIYGTIAMDEHMLNSPLALMPFRFGSVLAGVQGGIALLLAILGLYAVVAYGVTSRTREIGVRVALGATSRNIVRLVSREGLRLTAIGLALGLVMALGVSFVMSHVLIGISTLDPFAFPVVTIVLVATAAFACFWPARKATHVDPMTALRAE